MRLLWRTKLKNNLKAIHNHIYRAWAANVVVANQVKEQFESNSQLFAPLLFLGYRCGEPS